MEDEGYALSSKYRFHHSLAAFHYEHISAIDEITFSNIRSELFLGIKDKANFELEEQKEYRPDLLFEDEQIIDNIENHPMAL